VKLKIDSKSPPTLSCPTVVTQLLKWVRKMCGQSRRMTGWSVGRALRVAIANAAPGTRCTQL